MIFNEFFIKAYLLLSNPRHGSKANSIANPNPSYSCQLDFCKAPEARSNTIANSKAIPLAEINHSTKNAKLTLTLTLIFMLMSSLTFAKL